MFSSVLPYPLNSTLIAEMVLLCLKPFSLLVLSPSFLLPSVQPCVGVSFQHELHILSSGPVHVHGLFVLQNLAEAEYVVALFMYMRLLGYAAEKISILTTYNGQKHLIRDVIEQRCSGNPLLGRPHKVRPLSPATTHCLSFPNKWFASQTPNILGITSFFRRKIMFYSPSKISHYMCVYIIYIYIYIYIYRHIATESAQT